MLFCRWCPSFAKGEGARLSANTTKPSTARHEATEGDMSAGEEQAKVSLRRKRIDAAHVAKTPIRRRRLSPQKPQLSELHRAVVDAYFANGCVSRARAMIACGYSVKTARGNPHAVFGREDVQKEIEKRRNKASRRSEVTEDWVIEQYRKLASASMGDLLEVAEDGTAYLDLNAMTDEHRAALVEFRSEVEEEKGGVVIDEDGTPVMNQIKVRKSLIKFSSKQQALDSLARILGMFKDKLEVAGVTSIADKIAAARFRISSEAEAKREEYRFATAE